MKSFSYLVAVTTCLLLVSATAAAVAQDKPRQGKWIQLFNGKDLTGWTAKITGFEAGENFANTFRVEDGLLTVSYDKDKYDKFAGKFGHLFYNEPFSHYIIRVEYRFIGEQCPEGPGWALRNSGIMVHGQSPQSMRKEQNFPVSIEVQLLGGSGTGKRTTANLCTPGTNVEMGGKLVRRHCTGSQSKTYHGDRWVTVEVEVRGDEVIKHLVEGEIVMTYQKPQLDERDADARKLIKDGSKKLASGTISIQSESHPIQFRKIELMKLTP